MNKKKRIVIALGGNALGNTLPEQMAAVKVTSKAIVDLIEEGCEVVVTHGNGPQVGMINNAMIALTHEDAQQPNTPLSVCVAMLSASREVTAASSSKACAFNASNFSFIDFILSSLDGSESIRYAE